MEFKQILPISSDLGKGLIVGGTAKTKIFSIPNFPSSPKKAGWKKAVQQDHADIAACERPARLIKLLQRFPSATSETGVGTGEKKVNPTL